MGWRRPIVTRYWTSSALRARSRRVVIEPCCGPAIAAIALSITLAIS